MHGLCTFPLFCSSFHFFSDIEKALKFYDFSAVAFGGFENVGTLSDRAFKLGHTSLQKIDFSVKLDCFLKKRLDNMITKRIFPMIDQKGLVLVMIMSICSPYITVSIYNQNDKAI